MERGTENSEKFEKTITLNDQSYEVIQHCIEKLLFLCTKKIKIKILNTLD
jgi:hypothetical protein